MTYVRTIPDEEATGELAELYALHRQASGKLSNITRVVSLNPELLRGAFHLRSAFRRGSPNVDARRREMIATVAAALLCCTY
ncbi:MAG: hypothetical protein HY691_01445 [Chloroflexi bacterium]|nr:hypothetical protein [Chloroflexota bacterium]